jgi:Bacterial aa3 type cytochrome c oxidase subunit IV
MQSHTDHGQDSGRADMAEHLKTWHGFLTFMKWQVIAAVVILALLAIFRTHG